MRMTTHGMIAAAALLAASPALAQNETDMNVDANAVVTNDVGAVPTDNAVLPIDENAALPPDTTAVPLDTTAPPPAEDDDGFPWGVLGLLGLLGLIPRLRRR